MKKVNIAVALSLLIAGTASAGIIVTMQEVGIDVVVSFSGTMDTTGMGFGGGTRPLLGRIAPISPNIYLNANDEPGYFAHTGFGDNVWTVAPTAYGTGGATDGGIFSVGSDNFSFSAVSMELPDGYVSGTLISGSMTFLSENFTSLGITPAVNMVSVTGSGDTVTLQTIPEPSVLALVGVFGLGLAGVRRYFPRV